MNTRAWMPLLTAACLLAAATPVRGQLAARAEQLLEQERPRARDQAFHNLRAFPKRKLTPGVRRKALAQREVLARERQRIAARRKHASEVLGRDSVPAPAVVPSWTSIGPQPAQTIFTPIPAGNSGRATAIAIDPTLPTTVYLGTADGGVWKSTDAGGHWTALTDFQPSLAVGSLVLDPSDPQTIYVGTGEANFSGDSYFGAGILKSADGGATWTTLTSQFTYMHISAIAVSPANRALLLACNELGVWRSTDATSALPSFASVLGDLTGGVGFCDSVLFDPRNPNIAYAGFGFYDPSGESLIGVYKSTDAGLTWVAANGTAPNMLPANGGRMRLVMDPSNSATLYASVAPVYPAASPAGIYKSVDAGLNWTALTSPTPGQSFECCDWYSDVFAVSPANPNLLYAGAASLVQSLDGGSSWTPVGGYEQPAGLGDPVHPDQHAIAFTPDGATMYLANDGGIYKATAPGAAMNWQSLNTTLSTIQFYAGVAIDPQNLAHSLAGTQDNGTLQYSGMPRWSGTYTCGDGGYALFDYLNNQTIYVACSAAQGILKSVDGGNSWSFAGSGINFKDIAYWTPPLAMDPMNPQVLYYGTNKTYQSTDGGMNWQNISGNLGLMVGPVETIAVAPTDSNTVYVGRGNGAVDVSANALAGANATWIETTGIPGPSYIAVDPRDAATAISSSYTTVQRTTDRGATWSDISGNLPQIYASVVLIDPDLLNTYYVGNDVGVFYTVDAGLSWQVAGQGLPYVVVTGLAFDPGSRTLRAVTHGRGAWDIVLNLPLFAVGPASLGFGEQLVQVPSAVSTLTLSNNQTSFPLAVSSIAVAGDFQQSNNCGTMLAASASCKISVTFSPSVTGARSGSLTVTTGSGAQTVSLDGSGVLPSVALSANASTSTVQQPVTLSWSANAVACTGTGGVSGDGWAGARPLAGTLTVTALGLGAVTYGLTCTAGPNSAQAQTAVTYTEPSATITADAASATVTHVTTLSWNSANATACMAFGGLAGDGWGGSVGLQGSQSVTESVAGAQSYAIGCSAGRLTAFAEADVNFVPPTATLSASAASVPTATSVTLSWSSTGNSCTATGGASGDGWSGTVAVSGTQTVTERSAGGYSYGITCTAAALSVQAQATVTFTNPPSSGGGAFDALALLALAALAIARRRT